MLTVPVEVAEMPLIIGIVIPEPDNVLMMLLVILTFTPAVTVMPLTVARAPGAVEERVLILFALIFTMGEGFALANPVTAPPAPEDIKLLIILLETERVVAIPFAPMVNAVIAPCPVTFVMVFVETEDVPPNPLMVIPVIAEVPPVQLLNVFPVIVFVAGPTSRLLQPAMIVAPVTAIFEKLLLLLFTTAPIADVAAVVYNVRVPPAVPLLKAVTIVLPFTS
jgi:hypothetical protein